MPLKAIIKTAFVSITCAATLGMGCTTSAPIPERNRSFQPLVSSIQLSERIGEVGSKFSSKVTLHASRMGTTEMKIGSLPGGLVFDAETRTISGIPESDGFFSVTVAVRKARAPGMRFTTPDNAWYSERLDIEIYKPIQDEDFGWGAPLASTDTDSGTDDYDF